MQYESLFWLYMSIELCFFLPVDGRYSSGSISSAAGVGVGVGDDDGS